MLSAQTEAQLKTQARNLVNSIQTHYRADRELRSIAYTLQVGREAMEERLALIAPGIESLITQLQSFIAGTLSPNGSYRGSAKKDKDSLSIFTTNEELQEVIGKWIERRHYRPLLELWVKGLDIDWNQLYVEKKPRRISLPTYPFVRERYWLPETEIGKRVREEEVSVNWKIDASMPAAEAMALLRYREEWKPQPDEMSPAETEPILLLHFAEDEQQSADLKKLLEERTDQSRLIRVAKGAYFRQIDESHYEISAEEEADYLALCDSIGERTDFDKAGNRVALYGWGEGPQKIRGVHSLLKSSVQSGIELKRLIITGAALDDLNSCYDLSLIGYQRSLGVAMPQLSVTLLYGDEEGLRAEQIRRELWRPGIIRYQQGARYQLGFTAHSDTGDAPSVLRRQGVYLITVSYTHLTLPTIYSV